MESEDRYSVLDYVRKYIDKYKEIDEAAGGGYLNSALKRWYGKFLQWLTNGGTEKELAEVDYWIYTVDEENWKRIQAEGIIEYFNGKVADIAK